MTPEEALGGTDSVTELRRQGFSEFSVADDESEVVVRSTPGNVSRTLDISAASLPVRVITSDRSAIRLLRLPRSVPCVVQPDDHLDMGVQGPGLLIIELSIAREINLSGADVDTVRLAYNDTGRDSAVGTPAKVTLPHAKRLEIEGGAWQLGTEDLDGALIIDAELCNTSSVRCRHHLELRGRCVLRGSASLVSDTLAASGRIVLTEASSISANEIIGTLEFEATDDRTRVTTSRGSPRFHGEGPLTINCVGDTAMTEVTIDGPVSRLTVVECEKLTMKRVKRLEVERVVRSLSGEVGELAASAGTAVHCATDCEIGSIAMATDSEIFSLSPYRLQLKDLQMLDKARLVTFRFDRRTSHGEELRGVGSTREANEAAMVFWYRIGLLLERHGGTGAGRAVARRTEHEFRRRCISTPTWRTPEKAWLSIYRLLDYGDSAVRPLIAQFVLCALLTVGLLKSHLRWDRLWAVLWRLVIQPLRFFMRDDSRLVLEAPLVPKGWPSTFAPLLVQVVGAVLVAMSINAIRRLVKAR